jgi:hypothetical protein
MQQSVADPEPVSPQRASIQIKSLCPGYERRAFGEQFFDAQQIYFA